MKLFAVHLQVLKSREFIEASLPRATQGAMIRAALHFHMLVEELNAFEFSLALTAIESLDLRLFLLIL